MSIPAGAFVGRARELAALEQLLGGGARLVTLLGVAGVGKTRLALEWARASEGSRWREGATSAFCDLSAARSVDDACAALAGTLGVPLAASGTADEAVAQLGRALAELDRAVVILDNLEQLAALAPALLDPWLALAPRAQIIVTSRERLRLRDEVCLAVEPLGVPPADQAEAGAIAASEAVALFVARAQQVRADFALAGADAPSVAAIVRALEGIPLAIELCAARMGILGPSQILPRLARRFDLLVTGARDAPARHATLRAAITWSWDLLEPWEKEALAQGSVFRGGFSLDAAERVLTVGAGAPPVLDVLQSLHEKSLVRAFEPPGFPGERRYGLLESVRELAEEWLAELGGAAAMERHAAFFLGKTGSPLPRTGDIHRLVLEADNLAVAVERALARRPVTAADADAALRGLLILEPVYLASAKGRLEPYVAGLDAALAAAAPPVDPTVVARALYTRALADFLRGRVAECFAGFQRALLGARAAGARDHECLSLTKLGLMLAHEDRPEEAAACFAEARAIAVALDDPAIHGDYFVTRGGSLIWQARAEDAAWHQAEAVEKFRAAGDPQKESMAAGLLALSHLNQGRYHEGEAAAERALALLQPLSDQRTEGYVLGVRGRLHHARGRFDEARATLAAALAIHRAVGDRWSEGLHRGYLGYVAFEERRFADARAAYREAVARLRDTGERHYTAIFLAALGAAEVGHDDQAARACFEDAALALGGVRVPATRINVDLYRGIEDAHLARAAAASGDHAARDRHRSAAAAALARAEAPAPDGSPAAARSSGDVCFALRMLTRALDEAPAAAPLPPAARPSSMAGAVLVVGPEARWFRVQDREPVSMQKARAARLILARLAARRVEAPSAALSLDALFEAGWPGERIARKAAANRVYVTLTKLKNLGLRGLIQSRDDGFLLDPAAVVLEALESGPGEGAR